jgi:hypothetical protein
LGLAALAVLATAPCPPEARVTSLAVQEGTLYAGGLYAVEGMHPEAARSPNGFEWEAVEEAETLPEGVLRQFQEPVQLPVVECEAANPQVCYRITDSDRVEVSLDAGSTWEIAWRLPPGRRQYMERFLDSFLIGCKAHVDAGPYDLALLPSGKGEILVAAMGNEGALVRGEGGDWQRVAVLSAKPTPTRGLAPGVPFNWFFILFGETVRLFSLAALAWAGLTAGGVRFCLMNLETRPPRTVVWAIRPLWIGLGLSIVFGSGLLLVLALMRLAYAELIVPILLSMAGIVFWSAPFFAWRRAASLVVNRTPILAARRASFLAALGVFPAAWLPFAGWVFGVPPFYAAAVILAAVIGLASLGLGIRKILRRAASAADGAPRS